MLSKKLQDGLNRQINAELGSAYLYLSMAAWFDAENWPGAAAWMRVQAKEEVGHAMKIYAYVNDQDGRVKLAAIAAPPATFRNAQDVWQRTLEHEQEVTASIHGLYELAQREKDFATQALLQWFASEQVEEEKTARQLLEEVKKIGPSSTAMFFQDRHLGKRAEQGE
jgi:ferritin